MPPLFLAIIDIIFQLRRLSCVRNGYNHMFIMLLDKAVLPPSSPGIRQKRMSFPHPSNATIRHVQKGKLNSLYSGNSNAVSLLEVTQPITEEGDDILPRIFQIGKLPCPNSTNTLLIHFIP